jgi:NAD(P)-dependent dehydrogenase (short-subunit alcohol dehydrogenase family)
VPKEKICMPTDTVMIVGAGPGLGQALARVFARAGHPIALFARRRERLDASVAELRGERLRVSGYGADVTSADELRTAIEQAADELGPPSVLVYNAFVLQADRPSELSARALSDVLAVDVLGAVTAVNSFLPLLGDSGGTVLLTGGGLALQPSAQLASLSIGKAALRAYAQVLHEEQAERGVHVSTVTIAGVLQLGDERFDPHKVAATFLGVHLREPHEWVAEVLHC